MTSITLKMMQSKLGKNLLTAETDEPLFMHCAGGKLGVSRETFFKDVKPLLELHGVTQINYPEELDPIVNA